MIYENLQKKKKKNIYFCNLIFKNIIIILKLLIKIRKIIKINFFFFYYNYNSYNLFVNQKFIFMIFDLL